MDIRIETWDAYWRELEGNENITLIDFARKDGWWYDTRRKPNHDRSPP